MSEKKYRIYILDGLKTEIKNINLILDKQSNKIILFGMIFIHAIFKNIQI